MHGTVLATERLTPHLARVVLGGEGLAQMAAPGAADSYVNAFFLPEGAGYTAPFDLDEAKGLPADQRPYGRRMTVRAWDAARRELTLDIAVHDGGYAGSWAARAQPGDTLQMRGPGGGYSPDPDADWHLLVGDLSALPAIAVCAEQAPAGRPVLVVVEVEGLEDELSLDSPGDLEVHWVHGSQVGGGGAERLADAVRALTLPPGRGSAFVHGEAESIRAVRRVVLGAGVAPADLSCSPYWRRGHTDEEWRSVKSAWVREMNAEA